MTTTPTPPTDNLAAEGGPRSEMSERAGRTPVAHEHKWKDIGRGYAYVFMCDCGAFWGAA